MSIVDGNEQRALLSNSAKDPRVELVKEILGLRTAAMFALHFGFGWSLREVGELFDISKVAVHKAVQKGGKKLEQYWAGQKPDGG